MPFKPDENLKNFITPSDSGVVLPKTEEPKRISFLQQPGQYLSETATNIPSSGQRFLGGIASAVKHPVETITGLGRLGAGAVQSIPGISEAFTKRAAETGKTTMLEENRQIFQNVKDFFINRYGSVNALEDTIRTDPVGVAADVSILLSGAGGLLKSAKLGKLATATEPITTTARIFKTPVKPMVKGATIFGRESLGVTGGMGGETVRTAFESAKAGGGKYSQALRGKISQQDVLSIAKEGLETIKNQRTTTYKTQLGKIKDITKAIDLEPIKTKIKASLDNFNIKIKDGRLNFSKSTIADTAEQKRISSVVGEVLKWKDSTPTGLDVLKRRLDDFFTTSGQGRALTNSIRGEINDMLTKGVKGYAEMTKGYRESSDLINEIEKTLSLGGRATVDTTLRKLISALKRDADFRRELLTKLDDATQADVAGQIAGAILNPVVPSGLIGRSIFAGGPTALFLGSGTISPAMLYPILMSSPRVIGEFLNVLGISARYADNILKFLEKIKATETGRAVSRPLFQTGRLPLNE